MNGEYDIREIEGGAVVLTAVCKCRATVGEFQPCEEHKASLEMFKVQRQKMVDAAIEEQKRRYAAKVLNEASRPIS